MEKLERRKHFRIDDTIDFDYVVLNPAISDEEAFSELFDDDCLHHHQLNQQFKLLEAETSDILIRLNHDQPDVAALINQLDKKINILSHSLLLADERRLTPVNISLGGMAFYAEQAPEQGQTVKLRITTLPHYEQFIANAKVIYSKLKEHGRYKVIFKFNPLPLEQENLLNRHIFHVQSQSLTAHLHQPLDALQGSGSSADKEQTNDR